MKTVLASKSPRRREILSMLGIDFTVDTADIEEKSTESDPEEYAKDISRQKGSAVAVKYDDDTLVISCDTVVVINGRILGKPKDKAEAREMLRLLSGKTHKVISGLTLFYKEKVYSESETTSVKFAEIPEKVIEMYVESGDPLDKAGSYAAQGKTSLYIDKIDGCYFNVVGFPVRLFEKMLCKAGIDTSRYVF